MFKFFLDQLSLFGVKEKVDACGLRYGSSAARFTSVFLDLLTFIVLLYCVDYVYRFLFLTDQELKVLNKYTMGIELSVVEESVKSRYIIYQIFRQLTQFIFLFSAITWFWVKLGATPSKLILGLRIVDAKTFAHITFAQAVKRFFSIILSILPLFAGIICSNFSERAQTWHDKIAGTVVVNNKSLKDKK